MKFKQLFGLCFFSLFLCLSLSAQNLEDLKKAKKQVVNIEFAISDIDIFINQYDGETIAYKTEFLEGTKLSITEHKKKLRFIETKPAKGKIFVYVPKDFLLESFRILASHSEIKIDGIKAVHFSVSGNFNKTEIINSLLKNCLISLANGSLIFKNGIVTAADFCLNKTKADILIAEEKKDCNIFVTQQKNEVFVYEGEVYTKQVLSLKPNKPKKFISMSTAYSDIQIGFSPKLKEPAEGFDKYGLSEFGPVPSPNLVDNEANFLPKSTNSLP